MIHVLSWTTQKHEKNTFQANKFKVEENARTFLGKNEIQGLFKACLLYTSPSPRDGLLSRMPSSA